MTTITRGLTATLIFAGVAGGLAAPAVGAPPCSQWGFDGDFHIMQNNNWSTSFRSNGPRAAGPASANGPIEGNQRMFGTVDGVIDGYSIKFDVNWQSGSVGKYEGSVDGNGFASGRTYDAKHTNSSATWTASRPLRCMTPAPS